MRRRTTFFFQTTPLARLCLASLMSMGGTMRQLRDDPSASTRNPQLRVQRRPVLRTVSRLVKMRKMKSNKLVANLPRLQNMFRRQSHPRKARSCRNRPAPRSRGPRSHDLLTRKIIRNRSKTLPLRQLHHRRPSSRHPPLSRRRWHRPLASHRFDRLLREPPKSILLRLSNALEREPCSGSRYPDPRLDLLGPVLRGEVSGAALHQFR